MGDDGTNDDVFVSLQSDVDASQKCDMPKLSSFADDWSKNDEEKWDDDYFGPCEDKEFKVGLL